METKIVVNPHNAIECGKGKCLLLVIANDIQIVSIDVHDSNLTYSSLRNASLIMDNVAWRLTIK